MVGCGPSLFFGQVEVFREGVPVEVEEVGVFGHVEWSCADEWVAIEVVQTSIDYATAEIRRVTARCRPESI